MRLRRLALFGFKTFASRSEIAFDRGITAIVGPNGSGKSNLVDAVRWALGETNARELRGQRMDEVVYAGGGRRPRSNVAEVELLIDNEAGRLPVEGAEVAVSRRVVRGAHDTEYRVNGDRVRLRDLERLLGGTGLTQNGYAVVAQNDIDSIIEATPGQRRVLVEQAAGVRALRAACEEVLSRIGQAELALRRLNDLLDDAEPRLAELETQRAAALEQRELSASLAELRGSLAREEWRAARARLRQARRRLEQAAGRFEAAVEADAGFAERAASERSRLQRARALHDDAVARLETARVAIERADGEQRRLHDRLHHAVLQRALAGQELAAAMADAAALEASLAAGAAPRAAVDVAEQRLDAARRFAAEAADAAGAARSALEDADRELASAARVVEEGLTLARRLQMQHELLLVERRYRQQQIDAAETALAELRAAHAAAAAEAAAASGRAAEAEAARDAALSEVEAAWEHVNAADVTVAAASSAAREALASAARIAGALSGALGEGGVARAVAAGALAGRRLSECFTVRRPEDQIAIAAALEHHLGAWIVADVSAAAACFDPDGAREEVLSEAAGAVTGASAPASAPGRPAIGALEVAPEAASALAALLAGTRLVQDEAEAAAALEAGAVVAVLPDGRVVDRRSARGGGRPGQVLELAGEERAARLAATDATDQEARAIAAAADARERLAHAETRAGEAARAVVEARAGAAAARSALREREVALGAATETGASAANALREIEDRLDAVASEIARGRQQGAAADERMTDTAARRRQAEERMAAHRERLAAARRDEREAELELARLQESLPVGTLEEITRLLEGARRRAAAAELRLWSAESEAVAALVHGRVLRRHARQLTGAVTAAREQLDERVAPIADLERIVLGLEAEHAEVAVALARAEDERAQAEAEVLTAEAEVDRRVDEARDEDDSAEWDPVAAERAEREIVRLERRVASLGSVNALAPEQHVALEARVLAQRVARDDLDAACAELRRMTRKLAGDLERRFDAVFGAVSVHFQELFAELFPGGRATLRLAELPIDEGAEELADERASSAAERRPGVEILAQPPGKRLCPLRLLSGGERALTALATVLALQHVNPSPFYFFDEVDAALDDSNVLRFTRLLRRLARDQQFIVVTHNHITMAAADTLWGVTIDGDGVSSVIGVRFDGEIPVDVALTSALRPDERRAAG